MTEPQSVPAGPQLSSAQKTTLAFVSGCGVLSLLCCGAGGAVASFGVSATRQVVTHAAEVNAAENAKTAETKERLEQVADRLRREQELPQELPEAPPPDAWGRVVRYLRLDATRARLTSGGPDGEMRTGADNVEVDVRLR